VKAQSPNCESVGALVLGVRAASPSQARVPGERCKVSSSSESGHFQAEISAPCFHFHNDIFVIFTVLYCILELIHYILLSGSCDHFVYVAIRTLVME